MSKPVSEGYVAPWTNSTTRLDAKRSTPAGRLFRTCSWMPPSPAGMVKVSVTTRGTSPARGDAAEFAGLPAQAASSQINIKHVLERTASRFIALLQVAAEFFTDTAARLSVGGQM